MKQANQDESSKGQEIYRGNFERVAVQNDRTLYNTTMKQKKVQIIDELETKNRWEDCTEELYKKPIEVERDSIRRDFDELKIDNGTQ